MSGSEDSSGPCEEFSDAERISLILELEKQHGKPVATEAWACLWLSDLEKLRQIVNGVQAPDGGLAIKLLFREGNLLNELVKPCLCSYLVAYGVRHLI